MPLASWSALHWYGPGAGSMVGSGSASATALQLSGLGSMSAYATATATGYAKATRLRNSPMYATATATTLMGPMKARANMFMHGKVNELGQDDVTGAVLDAPVEGALTLRQLVRIMSAAVAGKVSVSGNTVTFRDLNDSKDRMVSTTDSNGQRTAITVDGT